MAGMGIDETGKRIGVRPIRIVAGMTAANELGQTVETTPVRYAFDPITTDALGRPVGVPPVEVLTDLITTDEVGRSVPVKPCRIVDALTTQDSAGRPVDVVPVLYDPIAVLGASLLAFWDAEVASTLTLSGPSVTTWTDRKVGYAPTQAVGGSKPLYSATSFNGRPGITFDGLDDYLLLASSSIPSGAIDLELWALLDQTSLVADTTDRYALSIGGAASVNNQVRLMRSVVSGVNRAGARAGNGTTNNGVNTIAADFSGRHVIRAKFNQSGFSVAIDGSALTTSASIIPNTTGTAIALGANLAGGGAAKCVMNAALITSALNADQAAQLTQYLKTRGGIA